MRILILGGNGMIGHKMYQKLVMHFPDTWVILKKKLTDIPYRSIFNTQKVVDQVELSNFRDLELILNKIDPDILINAAGITIRRGVNDIISRSIIVNSALPHFLEEWVTVNKEKRLIHFSTDCVFSGKKGAYTEDDTLDALDIYGKTKGIGEVSGIQSLTLRGSMIGRELDNYTELLEWFLMQKGKTVKGFSNAIYSGVTTVRMAKFVVEIIKNHQKLSGIFNVSSVPISKFQLLHLFKETFGCNTIIVEDASYSARKDMLSKNFYNSTGLMMPEWHDLMSELKEDSLFYSDFYKTL